MNATDLNDTEMLALVVLSRVLVAADGKLAVEEMQELNEIGLDLGVENFTRISKVADGQASTVEHALELAGGVERTGARDLIQTMLADLAGTDGVDAAETAILDQLKEAWS